MATQIQNYKNPNVCELRLIIAHKLLYNIFFQVNASWARAISDYRGGHLFINFSHICFTAFIAHLKNLSLVNQLFAKRDDNDISDLKVY